MIPLLIIIYVAFISLGLPDAVLGSTWPVIYVKYGVDIGAVASQISFIIMTIVLLGFLAIEYFSTQMVHSQIKSARE